MMSQAAQSLITFAEKLRALPVAHRVNALGGYGSSGEVIYDCPPPNCPSVLVENYKDANFTAMSNGSVEFLVKNQRGMEIEVLRGSFDPVAKQETGVLASNVWVEMNHRETSRFASVVNPRIGQGLTPSRTRIVKLSAPNKAMWFLTEFRPMPGVWLFSAVRYALAYIAAGPVLCRDIVVKNFGTKKFDAHIWTYFDLHGTQKYAYDKPIWFDSGLPVNLTETVVSETTPWCDYIQIKRVSTQLVRAQAVAATCDYADFVGDSSATALLPETVKRGRFLTENTGKKWNRFITPTIAANQFAVSLQPGGTAAICQTLLYITNEQLITQFRKTSCSNTPSYEAMEARYRCAAERLIRATHSAGEIPRRADNNAGQKAFPFFELRLPHQPIVAMYANSSWDGVDQIYENCRSHGAKLADGIEVGTRDRGQDMWPKMKENPGRVRDDLTHAFSFMYRTCSPPPQAGRNPLTLVQKLHGMFPRQYPSVWRDRSTKVANDNRPYADSPLWLINSLIMYLRETGDAAILDEKVKTIRLTLPEQPDKSQIAGCDTTYPILTVVFEIFACFERHIADSPFGLPQILGGDWCDPVDMFGTSRVGDFDTLGHGRGTQIRLAGHLFETIIQVIDLCQASAVQSRVKKLKLESQLSRLPMMADRLRQNALKFAWEDGRANFAAGFIDSIHELKANSRRPRYAQGEIGYAFGSMKGDVDGRKRRVLPSNAYGLRFLSLQRDYLTPVKGAAEMIKKLLHAVDRIFFDPSIGLMLFSTPCANTERNGRLIGRINTLPPGCSENGEYHHGQMFMHAFRLLVPGEADTVWRQFKPMLSAMRDEKLGGPFESAACSYQTEKQDPHFGQGMYFGLSGTVDWMIEFFQSLVGLELNLIDPRQPAVRLQPRLPKELGDTLTFKRIIHVSQQSGGYRQIPLTLDFSREGQGSVLRETRTRINGLRAPAPEVRDLKRYKSLHIEVTRVYGHDALPFARSPRQ
ncbi:MAG: hypothetical protein V1899_08545 [Planctomycetota bacterium]